MAISFVKVTIASFARSEPILRCGTSRGLVSHVVNRGVTLLPMLCTKINNTVINWPRITGATENTHGDGLRVRTYGNQITDKGQLLSISGPGDLMRYDF